MKKIIGLILSFALVLSLALTLTSCGDGMKEYTELGLNFKLPKDFRKLTVQGADLHYSTPDASFELQYMPKSEFEDAEMGYYISFDMTVKEYAEFLINENGWADSEKTEQYVYDEARDAASFYFFWTPDIEEFPYSYYYFTIMKSSYAFYVVMFSCEEEKYPEYSEKFVAWSNYLSLVENPQTEG